MTYEPPIDHGPSSLLELQAIEIADLKAEVERLKTELQKRAGDFIGDTVNRFYGETQ